MIKQLLNYGLIPNVFIDFAINHSIKDRLQSEMKNFNHSHGQNKQQLIQTLKKSAIALSTKEANQQHYQVPTQFYQQILGPYLKYSCCLYDRANTLAEAEVAMLKLYCERAGIANNQKILDLGCGWGSLSFFLAENYPNSEIIGISNSQTQKEFIEKECVRRKITTIKIITADVNSLDLTEKFDRIISIEMFEHIRNYTLLLQKIKKWLKPDAKLFVHFFCHDHLLYPFESNNSWMAKHFFQDGLMPSQDILSYFNESVTVEQQWKVNGSHYAKTCNDWLKNLHKKKGVILDILGANYSKPRLQYAYWEIFLKSCEKLFNYNKGNEWFVTHCLLRPT